MSSYQAHSLHISRLIFNGVCDFIKEKNEKCIITCRNKVFKHQLVPCINSVKINNRNFLFQSPICPTSDTAAVGYCYNFTDPILCKVSTEKYFLKLHILKSTKFNFFWLTYWFIRFTYWFNFWVSLYWHSSILYIYKNIIKNRITVPVSNQSFRHREVLLFKFSSWRTRNLSGNFTL